MAGELIEFRTTDGDLRVTCYRGESSAKLSGGVGGWEEVDRPRRTAGTRWAGKSPFRMTVPIIFDGYKKSDSQEEEITRLIHMGLPPGDFRDPRRIKVSGGTPGDRYTWVIEDIEWGDNVVWGFTGRGVAVRYRQDAVLHLLQYVGVELIRTGKTGGQRKGRTYIVRRGDTLSSIAARLCGDRRKWKAIARANNIRDPKSIKPGQRLRVPC